MSVLSGPTHHVVFAVASATQPTAVPGGQLDGESSRPFHDASDKWVELCAGRRWHGEVSSRCSCLTIAPSVSRSAIRLFHVSSKHSHPYTLFAWMLHSNLCGTRFRLAMKKHLVFTSFRVFTVCSTILSTLRYPYLKPSGPSSVRGFHP